MPEAGAETFACAITVAQTVLAFDVGSRRIGVAVGTRFTGDGRRLAVIANGGHAAVLDAIAPLVAQWQPQALLVGMPLTLEGGEQPASDRARGFARVLHRRFALPVLAVDERHSSQEAARRFAAGRALGLRRRQQADDLDADAAAVLVRRYYDRPDQLLFTLPPAPDAPP